MNTIAFLKSGRRNTAPRNSNLWYNMRKATVAQLDRALASEAEGCWFDPSQSHQ